MKGRTTMGSARAALGAGLRSWLAAFGQCPTPERDAGLGAWSHLRGRGRRAGDPPILGGPLVDDPHLAIGTSL